MYVEETATSTYRGSQLSLLLGNLVDQGLHSNLLQFVITDWDPTLGGGGEVGNNWLLNNSLLQRLTGGSSTNSSQHF